MDIDRISSELKFANRIGQTLSTEEIISLQSSVLKLSHEYKFERYYFWGRVEGTSGNYYIVEAANFRGANHFPHKKYFWRYSRPHAAPKTSSSRNCPPIVMSLRRGCAAWGSSSLASMRRS
jgi:hypothetical protein